MYRTAALLCLIISVPLAALPQVPARDGNRLAYLDGAVDPYYPGTGFAKLTTAQWIGEPGIVAAAILSIDDMREPAKYEAFLRPILERLKRVEGGGGRAPLSIFTCEIDPHDAQLQTWLEEGLSIEVHTTRHPCPLLAGGDFAAAKQTVDVCIDLLKGIPNMGPVCFRMPCCDSMNSLSPRFFTEIFNQTTPRGSFLQSDSSMFVLFNEKEKQLPVELVADNRFAKYMPRLRGWVNWIENYPYPYVIGTRCWEFPSVIPSDWEAQNRHGVNQQETVDDLAAALDATVIMEGLFTFVFHPHGWIKNSQVVELIEHAERQHGGKLRFLNVREATERITKNMLLGQPLRKPDGSDNGVRVLDLNNDGYMDVVIGNAEMRKTRLWDPVEKQWDDSSFPARLDVGRAAFGILGKDGHASVTLAGADGDPVGLFRFEPGGDWVLEHRDARWLFHKLRFRDVDGDGICEMIDGNSVRKAPVVGGAWRTMGSAKFTEGARLVDLDGDGDLDSIFSDSEHFDVSLFDSENEAWSIEGRRGQRGGNDADEEIPPITRADGSNNGAWIHGQRMYWQNEDSVTPQSQVISRAFEFMRSPLPEKVGVLESKPLDTDAALASIATSLDLAVELVAAEPEVMDPIDLAWGNDGKLWVVEMADYPLGIEGKPGGRVRCLEDRDGDGRYERSVVFADRLPFPTGVMPWRDGVLILAAPDLIYAEDRDGDGAADHREVLYRGFGQGNQQHRANGLRWGLDNWIYLANGDSGGVIESVKSGAKIDISGRDLRIRPDTGELEAQSGRTQYGRNRDAWGNWFGCNNSTPVWHFVLPDHYLNRNLHVAVPSPTVNLVRSGGRPEVYPISQPLERFNEQDNLKRITSACGAMIYSDALLPLTNNALVCEPVHNLILRQIVTPDAYTFRGMRAANEQRSEFFSSTDPWCRPVAIRSGPDACLYVADMYRLVIEHPEWISDEWQEKLDLRSGHDRGRIYRIRPKDHVPERPPDLRNLAMPDLVALLGSPNSTLRDLVHRSILWRSDEGSGARPHLERMLDHPNPTSRIQSLCVLDGLGELESSHIGPALDDAHPGVRRQALRLCERIADPPIAQLARLVNDPDPQVRLQLAFTLGEFQDERAGKILTRVARSYGDDPHMAAAVISSAIPHLGALAPVMGALPDALRRALLTTIGKEGGDRQVLDMLTGDPSAESNLVLLGILRSRGAIERVHLQHLIDAATAEVFAASSPSPNAIRLLGLAGEGAQLTRLLEPGASPETQAAAVEAIGSAPILLRQWEKHSPVLRKEIVGELCKDQNNASAILDHFERQAQEGRAFFGYLSNHPDQRIRQRAAEHFQQKPSSRAEVIARYRKTSGNQPDSARGREIFAAACAACHLLGGIGKVVGPDLSALTDRSPEALLTAILDPNRAVEDKFVTYLIDLRKGSTHAGMISSETGPAIVLTLLDGSSETILRSDIEATRNIGRSLMPEGLEATISPDEMQDLIAWISRSREIPRSFPGNLAETIESSEDGSFYLAATHAEIFGREIVFEEKFKNLGFWSGEDDHAVWSIDCGDPGRYAVELDFACADEVAGNRFRFGRIHGVVPTTGGWENYQRKAIGEIELTRGINRLAFRPSTAPSGYLLDLRSIMLRPKR